MANTITILSRGGTPYDLRRWPLAARAPGGGQPARARAIIVKRNSTPSALLAGDGRELAAELSPGQVVVVDETEQNLLGVYPSRQAAELRWRFVGDEQALAPPPEKPLEAAAERPARRPAGRK